MESTLKTKKVKWIVTIAAVVLLIGCILFVKYADRERTIKDYRINAVCVQNMPDAEAFLKERVKELYDIRLSTTTDEARGHQIYLISDEAYAERIGYKLSEIRDGFLIANFYESLYILSASEKGVERAISYFVNNMIDDYGRITLDVGEKYVNDGTLLKRDVTIGDTFIGEYDISYDDGKILEVCERLNYYVQQTGNVRLNVVSKEKAGNNQIYLLTDAGLQDGEKIITIENGQVQIKASDIESLYEGVYLFANTYLGWMNAGTERERISNVASEIHIPEEAVWQEAWIEEREAIITLWNINYNRGFYLNGDTTLENSIMDFSEAQLYEYVKMLKYCGFTGIQITEMCSAWAGHGGYEAVHDKIRILADAAHSLDMNVTLWVWGAEFTGYGWVDNSVTYDKGAYEFAYQNPEVAETFEKYYAIYAELADCCDRLIGHFYDPGQLSTAEDIAYFSRVLRDKFKAINSEIDFGISCWVDAYDKDVFVRELGNDITLYESGHHDKEGDYITFRNYVVDKGCKLGTWAWNTCEMEIDQLAQMNFNMDIIREVYQTARQYDEICKPSYWSEMDSYHVLNVFSLYCAGQMLINPDIEEDVLYQKISEATVGKEYAQAFTELLRILQDARSGSSWESYWWKSENYILKKDDYPAQEILNRCNQYIPVLEEMIEKEVEANTLPLPVSLHQLLSMMRPHLEQIRAFAQFRVAFAEFLQEYEQGMDMALAQTRLYALATPIDSYNCIIGTWGQIEARAQREMVEAFCNRTGVELPVYGYYDKQRKDFIYAQIVMYQKGQTEPVEIAAPYYQYGFAYGVKETNRLIEEMVLEGLLIRTERGTVYLADWNNYIYHFS